MEPQRTTPGLPTPSKRCVILKFDDNGSCRIHGISDGDKEIVTNERYFVMPWKMINVDETRVNLKETVAEIFSSQDELINSTYITIKLYEKGSCRIHSAKNGDKEIVTNKTYVVMPWKMVTRNGKNMTIKEAVEKIEAHRRKIEEERMLVLNLRPNIVMK